LRSVCSTTKTHSDTAFKVPVSFFNRIHIKGIGEYKKLLTRVFAFRFPPFDNPLAALYRRSAIGTKTGPVSDPVGRIAQECSRPESIGEHNQQIATIIAVPILQYTIGCVS